MKVPFIPTHYVTVYRDADSGDYIKTSTTRVVYSSEPFSIIETGHSDSQEDSGEVYTTRQAIGLTYKPVQRGDRVVTSNRQEWEVAHVEYGPLFNAYTLDLRSNT